MILPTTKDPLLQTFEVNIQKITFAELNAWCSSTRKKIDDYQKGSQFYLPADYLRDLSGHIIEEVFKKYGTDFPIKNALLCTTGAHSSSFYHKIFVNEDFTCSLQIRTQNCLRESLPKTHKEIMCGVWITKAVSEEPEKTVFSGVLHFAGEKSYD